MTFPVISLHTSWAYEKLKADERKDLQALCEVSSDLATGQVEGFVNKLKLTKRQGDGRASFPLLRQRVLYAV